jgi:hypothetical protein
MNLLIVANRKCGAHTIFKWLEKEFKNQYAKGEEIDNNFQNHKFIIYSNDTNAIDFNKMEKMVVLMYFKDYEKLELPEEYFDFTISITRNDTVEQAESIIFTDKTGKGEKPYIIPKEFINENKELINETSDLLKINNEKMNNIFGLHVTYEDLFDSTTPQDLWNVQSYLGILYNNFYWTIKPTFKLRRFNNSII